MATTNVGGLKVQGDVSEEVIEICNAVKAEIEEKTGIKYAEFRPLKYATQVQTSLN